mgnify:CR=1 FL=1
MSKYNLFEGYGIEIEYMIVDAETYKVTPVADMLLSKLAGEPVSEYSEDGLGYSNELVKHVIELKTDGPAKSLEHLANQFHKGVQRVSEILKDMNCILMPTAMHPFMVPEKETQLWQDESAEIYETYDRIFNCKGHGWSNLQSVHINLPFAGDEQFRRLHAAIRPILPIIPALAASSPIVEREVTGILDNRLAFYRKNQRTVPEVAGSIIPERVYTEAEYNKDIFSVIKKAIAPHDPEEILDPIWLNSRGAIARFDRGAIEIRLIDVQECPKADIAVALLVSESVRLLTKYNNIEKLCRIDEKRLLEILLSCIKDGENTLIDDMDYLSIFDIEEPVRASEIWKYLFFETGVNKNAEYSGALTNIFDNGTLSTRIKKSRRSISETYIKLCECLINNKVYND